MMIINPIIKDEPGSDCIKFNIYHLISCRPVISRSFDAYFEYNNQATWNYSGLRSFSNTSANVLLLGDKTLKLIYNLLIKNFLGYLNFQLRYPGISSIFTLNFLFDIFLFEFFPYKLAVDYLQLT